MVVYWHSSLFQTSLIFWLQHAKVLVDYISHAYAVNCFIKIMRSFIHLIIIWKMIVNIFEWEAFFKRELAYNKYCMVILSYNFRHTSLFRPLNTFRDYFISTICLFFAYYFPRVRHGYFWLSLPLGGTRALWDCIWGQL